MENVHLYAVRLEPTRLVAAEVGDQTAAALLDEGRPLLLATEAELIALARRRQKSLTLLSRQPPGRAARGPAPTARTAPAAELAEVA